MKPDITPAPRPFKAVISPCSECQNYQNETGSGFPVCPRRSWEQRAADAEEDDSLPTPPTYLTLKNNDGSDGLANPVYDPTSQVVVVWVAAIQDNRITLDSQGQIVTGGILEQEAFDTRYIQCRSLPVHPEETWGALVTSGLYKEWDRLVVTPMTEDQEETGEGANPDPVMLGGVCRKSNFAFGFSMLSPSVDQIASGC